MFLEVCSLFAVQRLNKTITRFVTTLVKTSTTYTRVTLKRIT